MPAPKEIRIGLLTQYPLLDRDGLERMLSALASVDLEPTHAGLRESPKDEYDLQEFVETVASKASTSSMPCFDRRKAPKYTGFFNPQRDKLSMAKLTFTGKQGATPYTAGDALAEALAIEFGFVHPIVEGAGRPWNAAGNTTQDEFQKYGLQGICARTYFGPHLVSLIGAKRITDAGGRITANGAVLDLAPRPWDADIDTLKARQAEVTKAFDPAGVFGDFMDRTRGKRWKPLAMGN